MILGLVRASSSSRTLAERRMNARHLADLPLHACS
jgi:hypothetical protein